MMFCVIIVDDDDYDYCNCDEKFFLFANIIIGEDQFEKAKENENVIKIRGGLLL